MLPQKAQALESAVDTATAIHPATARGLESRPHVRGSRSGDTAEISCKARFDDALVVALIPSAVMGQQP
jgi:hypothetical protein